MIRREGNMNNFRPWMSKKQIRPGNEWHLYSFFSMDICCGKNNKGDRNTRYCKLGSIGISLKVLFFFKISKYCEKGNIFIFCLLFLDLQGPWKCKSKKNLCRFNLLISKWLPLLNYFYLIPLLLFPMLQSAILQSQVMVNSLSEAISTLAEIPFSIGHPLK